MLDSIASEEKKKKDIQEAKKVKKEETKWVLTQVFCLTKYMKSTLDQRWA